MNKLFGSEEIKLIEKHYTVQSIDNVQSLIKKVYKTVPLEHFKDINNKFDEFIDMMEKGDYSISTKANMVFQVIKLLKLIGVTPNEQYTLLSVELKEKRKKEDEKKRDEKKLSNVSAETLYEYVKSENKPSNIIAMFSILRCCPLRVSEFFEMRFMNHKDANFIDLSNSCIYVRQHKNGTNERIVKLDEQAVQDLKTFKNDNPYVIELFQHKTKKQIQNVFSQVLKTFKKKNNIVGSLGIHDLRTQEEMKNMSNLKPGMNTEELNKMIDRCGELGHSLKTALQFYTVVQKDEEPEPTEEKEIIKVLDHEGDDHKPTKLYVKFVDSSMRWLDINQVNMWEICELITKYKRSL